MCEHEGKPCPGRSCRCECMNCMFGDDEDGFNQPCQTCGVDGQCKPDCDEAAYNKWLQERVDRLGEELAMLPDFFECYACGRTPNMLGIRVDKFGMKYVMRRPVGLGPIAEAHRDPTQTYRLECGHIEM